MTKAKAKRDACWDVVCWIQGSIDIRALDTYTDSHGDELSDADYKLKINAYEEIMEELTRRSNPQKRKPRA